MFERFTDNARKLMALANSEAHSESASAIGPRHMLYAMASLDCHARLILERLRTDVPRLETMIRNAAPAGSPRFLPISKLAQTAGSKAAIESAISESRLLGHTYVGTEHVLLGLAHVHEDGIAAAFGALGLSLEALRAGVLRSLNGEEEPPGDATTHSTRAAEPVGAYAHARRVGNLLFLAGLGPRRRGSKDIPGVKLDTAGKVLDYDIEAQVRACFENVKIVLEEAGSRWENIIDVTVFLTNMKRDFGAYNALWAEYFPVGPNSPTRTTLEVLSLPTAGNAPIAFEVKVIATV